ncbi:hypothetical protein N8835_00460 [Alphaproteobacteria bacterium]|nr:hypothetical protein [Alphaproteobacteria bacterium]
MPIKTDQMPNDPADNPNAHGPAHFVPLAVIKSDHNGELLRYMRGEACQDVVVTMPVRVDVRKVGQQNFFVAVATTMNFETAEALQDEANRLCPDDHRCLFAWIPADLFGSDDFGIFIDELGIGDKLQNGLVGEVINAASIEEAVASLAG